MANKKTYLHLGLGMVELRLGRFTLDESHIQRLKRTLSILPPRHVRGLQYIGLRDRANYAGGSTNIASEPWLLSADGSWYWGQYWVMLDIDSFDPRRRAINNRPNGLHYTLLHEMGHVADWTTGAFQWMQRNDPEGCRLLSRRHHAGSITTGEQEKFADTYADLFYYPQGNRLRDDCIRAILKSPAFTCLPEWTRLPNGWSVERSA